MQHYLGDPFCVESTSHDYVVDNVVDHALFHAYAKDKCAKKPKERKEITDFTYIAIVTRNRILTQYHRYYDRFTSTPMFSTFMVWKFSSIKIQWSFIFGLNRRGNLINYCRYRAQLYYHNRHVSAYVAMDRLAGFDARADELHSYLETGDLIAHHRVARNN